MGPNGTGDTGATTASAARWTPTATTGRGTPATGTPTTFHGSSAAAGSACDAAGDRRANRRAIEGRRSPFGGKQLGRRRSNNLLGCS